MKNKLLEASGEESNMDVTSESGSNTDVVTDTDDDNVEGTSSAKRRKLKPSERDLQMPLERGWKRETVIRGLGKTGVIKGDVSYYSPCGKTFRSSPDLVKVRVSVYLAYRASGSWETEVCSVRIADAMRGRNVDSFSSGRTLLISVFFYPF